MASVVPMSEPKVLLDLEFHFASGEPLIVSLEEGRDIIAKDDARFRIQVNHSEAEIEEHIIDLPKVQRMKTVKRIVQPETKVAHG
jgi:hypothetical protein